MRKGEGIQMCTIESCNGQHKAKGMCGKHYQRSRAAPRKPRLTAEQRFWIKVEKTDSCWNWTAGKNPAGYGSFFDGGWRMAHRYSWELHNGPIGAGLELDHKCHHQGCVNPDHLRPVTPAENHQNRNGAQSNNLSCGIRGVTWRKESRKWQAIVTQNRKSHYLGLFAELANAEAAVVAKRNELFTYNDADRKRERLRWKS